MEKYRKKTIVADSSPLIALTSINQISSGIPQEFWIEFQ